MDNVDEEFYSIVITSVRDESGCDAFLSMWEGAVATMSDQPGFIMTRMYRSASPDGISLVNISTWRSRQEWATAMSICPMSPLPDATVEASEGRLIREVRATAVR
jgi:hypothetical protein